jgi:hypothetical protein
MMAYSPHRHSVTCSTKMSYSFVPGTRLDRPPIEYMTYGHNRRPFPFLILHKARACLHSLGQLQCWIVMKNLSLQIFFQMGTDDLYSRLYMHIYDCIIEEEKNKCSYSYSYYT